MTDPMIQAQIKAARRRARGNLLAVFTERRNAFTIGWCAAFVQWGCLHIVQRAHIAEVRS